MNLTVNMELKKTKKTHYLKRAKIDNWIEMEFFFFSFKSRNIKLFSYKVKCLFLLQLLSKIKFCFLNYEKKKKGFGKVKCFRLSVFVGHKLKIFFFIIQLSICKKYESIWLILTEKEMTSRNPKTVLKQELLCNNLG